MHLLSDAMWAALCGGRGVGGAGGASGVQTQAQAQERPTAIAAPPGNGGTKHLQGPSGNACAIAVC
jgi:hypothetical protein